MGKGRRLKFPRSRLSGYVLDTTNSPSPPSSPPSSPMSSSGKFGRVIDFLRKQLHRDTLNFGIDGKLVVNYACSMAWG
ncbi:hypothetical protein KSS87_014260 [Heliosperma pusillum]|nr:hypothetical protein KSS87_014260 [Heliosperma pusillum]